MPEVTEGREGFLHPYEMAGGVAEARLKILLRDFSTPALAGHADVLRRAAAETARAVPGVEFDIQVKVQYRNMGEGLAKEPRAVRYAERALEKLGFQAELAIVCGGTDGSRLTEMGLPTPNLSTGQHTPHSPLEWACLEEMEQSVAWIMAIKPKPGPRPSIRPAATRPRSSRWQNGRFSPSAFPVGGIGCCRERARRCSRGVGSHRRCGPAAATEWPGSRGERAHVDHLGQVEGPALRVGAQEERTQAEGSLVADDLDVVPVEAGQFDRPIDGLFNEADFVNQPGFLRLLGGEYLAGGQFLEGLVIALELGPIRADDGLEPPESFVHQLLEDCPFFLGHFACQAAHRFQPVAGDAVLLTPNWSSKPEKL